MSLSTSIIGPPHLGQDQGSLDSGGGGLLLGLRCPSEQLEAKWQGGGTFAVGQEAEVADARETFREQVQEEAAQELIERSGHQLLVVVGGTAPTKRDLAISKRDQSMVGDGYTMGVTAKITEYLLRPANGGFALTTQSFRNSGLSHAAKIFG